MKGKKGVNTDTVMMSLYQCLARDFKSVGYIDEYERELPEIRKLGMPTFDLPVNVFKAKYQLASLFKRYRFEKDAFTDEELEINTNEKFLRNQERVACLSLPPSTSMHAVLQKARILIRGVLGKYDEEEHASRCCFGKRAKSDRSHVVL